MTAFMEIGAADQVMFDGREGKSEAGRPRPAFISSHTRNFGKKELIQVSTQGCCPASRHISIFDDRLFITPCKIGAARSHDAAPILAFETVCLFVNVCVFSVYGKFGGMTGRRRSCGDDCSPLKSYG